MADLYITCDACGARHHAFAWVIVQHPGDGNGYIACPKCGHEEQASRDRIADMELQQGEAEISRDALLREVRRSLEATHPERAEMLVRTLERRLQPDWSPKNARLLDGTPTRVGMKVEMDWEAMDADGFGHGWDNKVHTITSLLSGDTPLVECGPRQIAAAYLRRHIPGTSAPK